MSDIDFQNGFICGMATKGLIKTGSQGSEGKRVARFTIGTTQNGWTAEEVDYLCDGVDDQEEIIQALNDLPETGGEVVILDGTYNITASINIPKDNVSLRGNGNATTLKRMYNSTSAKSGPTARGLITLFGQSGCKIQGLQIDGNKATYTAGYNYGIFLTGDSDSSSNDNTIAGNTCNNNINGIRLYYSNNNTVTGNICNNNEYYGIYLDHADNNTVTGNNCAYNNSDGIHLDASSNKNTVTGNTCTDNSDGISLSSSSDNTITDNTCNNNQYSGIDLYYSNNNTVTGNNCISNDYGIRLDHANNNTVTGNTCNNSNYGIYLDLTNSDNTITGNTCNKNGRGIYLYYSANNNTVTGNTCNNNYHHGIYLYESDNNTITGNTCNNNQYSGIYLDSSSDNTITGNTCMRGTYTSVQYTIFLSGTNNNYNLISLNNCMGKAVVVEGGTGNSVWGNKFDATDDLP